MSIINAGSNTSRKYEHNQGNGLTYAILRTVETIKRKRMRTLAGPAAQAMEKPHNSPVGGTGWQSKQGASTGITTSSKTGRSCSSKMVLNLSCISYDK
jgi:hypothetical protein